MANVSNKKKNLAGGRDFISANKLNVMKKSLIRNNPEMLDVSGTSE